MERKRILVTAKAYPVESSSYDEVVCTAGITEEGDLIRIYPVPYRELPKEKQYKKYQWISIEVEKRARNKDMRKESYRCNIHTLACGEILDSKKHWKARKDAFIRRTKEYTDFSELLEDSSISRDDFISLAVFRPASIIGIEYKRLSASEIKSREDLQSKHDEQLEFDFKEDLGGYKPKPARIMPYNFYYSFLDSTGKEYKCLIEDWEIYSLYWRERDNGKSEEEAVLSVKSKFDVFCKNNDVWFFLGSRFKEHVIYRRKLNFFSIISVFYPLKEKEEALDPQLSLF